MTVQTSVFDVKMSSTCVRGSAAVPCIRDAVAAIHRRFNHWTPARVSTTPRRTSNLQHSQCLLSFEQAVDWLYRPVFLYTAALDFLHQFVRTGSIGLVHVLCRNSRIGCRQLQNFSYSKSLINVRFTILRIKTSQMKAILSLWTS